MTRRLIACGWTPETERLLNLLRARAGMEAVAVADDRPVALANAAVATDLPRYQHTIEAVRRIEQDVVLIDGTEDASNLIEAAAVRGSTILLRGDVADAEALDAAAEAANARGVALFLLRPLLRSAGLAFFSAQLGERRWRPHYVSLEIEGERSALALLRDGFAAYARLLPAAPLALAASHAGMRSAPEVISAHLRLPEGGMATITARRGPWSTLRIRALAAAGSAELDATAEHTTLTIAPDDGPIESTRLRHGDLLGAEVDHIVASPRGDALDALLAPREAALLRAVEQALTGDLAQAVEDRALRPALRVLQGGDQPSAASVPQPRFTLLSS
ncbi:MAG: hypothetical protein R3C39_06350 [Dehalococcoidia bacterium]